jgi:integrase
MGRLNALAVSRASKPGFHCDGDGLYLQVTRSGARTWVYRFMLQGKAREMGLGPLRDVPLAEARKRATECRRLRSAGTDPIEARIAQRKEAALEAARSKTFKECAATYIQDHSASWRNAKHRAQWTSTLETYAYPVFGDLPVQAVDTTLVMKALKPMWDAKVSTAARLRGRIESVLDWAKAHGFRTGENPARWRGHIENMLPALSKVRAVQHHKALPYLEIGAFMKALRANEGVAAGALELLILTATRTSETINARWAEFDLEVGIWTVPAARMKAGREHRIPLSAAAISLLKTLPSNGDFLFPGGKRGKPLSNMAMLALLKRMDYSHITAHGFRSTFRDWAAEQTNHSQDVAEMALAHTISNKVEAAYRRGDLFEKRKALMEDWSRYCTGVQPDNVINLRRNTSLK